MNPDPPSKGLYRAQVWRALAQQRQLTGCFIPTGWPEQVRYVGGADAAYAPADAHTPSGRSGSVGSPAVGIAVVWDLLERRIVEQRYARRRVTFPYVPGLLSFREAPLLLAAIQRIRTTVDVWMFDGQGISHPRGLGLATYMGWKLDSPTVGAAKSILVGEIVSQNEVIASPDGRPIPAANLIWKGQVVARVLWTRPGSEPMIISQGYRCTLDQAVSVVLNCTLPGERMPEPTRVADAWTKQVRLLSAREGRRLVEGEIK